MRRRRTNNQIQQLEHQILEELADDHPQSVRHLFYRMTDPRLPEPVEKSERGYVAVQRRVVEMRRARIIPYSWITDATRRGYFTETWDTAAEAVEGVAQFYRRSYWSTAPHYLEVWCESRSIAGTIEKVCSARAVPLYPSGGFASLSLVYQAAEHIRAHARERPAVIFYIGDWDAAGCLIDKQIERDLRDHLPDIDLTFDRLAITREQIDLMGLPTKPGKDVRGGFKGGTVEAEAMPARVLRQLLDDAITSFMNPDELQVLEVAEASEREWLHGIARAMREQEAAP